MTITDIYRKVHNELPAPHQADWVEHAIFWQIYPLGFVGAEIRPAAGPEMAHTLGKLAQWLDYAVDLGVSGLLLGPIFASTSHGYDTTDHFRLDPRLGDESDFDALIEAAGKRGLRVVLDGVFNHVSRRASRVPRGPGAERAGCPFRLVSAPASERRRRRRGLRGVRRPSGSRRA